MAGWLLTACLMLTGVVAGCASRHPAAEADATVGAAIEEAVVYALPVYEIARTRYRAIADPENPQRGTVNLFTHSRGLADHTRRAVTTPNADTLYSSAWLDLSVYALALSVPDTGGRYYSLQFMDIFTNTSPWSGAARRAPRSASSWSSDWVGRGGPRPG